MLTLIGLDDGHVLQRRPEGASITAHLFGVNDPDPKATVSVGRVHLVSTGEGLTRVELSELPAGGPYHLTIEPAEGPVLRREFYVGDLWLLAGQSNMEGVGLLSGACEPHPLVRSFSMARQWALAREPLHFLAESPDEVHHGGFPLGPEEAAKAKFSAQRGSGVGLPFARLMVEKTGVPQGLLCVAHGGTSMAQWSPGQPLYASMMHSVRAVNQPLAGVLWYQGCSDTNTPEDAAQYAPRTVNLIETLRRELAQPQLPWLVVQIGTEVGRAALVEEWHRVQEMQRNLPHLVAQLDVCAAADLEHDDWIHLSSRAFPELARRLMVLAQRLVLNDGATLPAPQPLRVRWAPDEISAALVVECAHIAGDLRSGGLPMGFTLCDATGRERPLIYQVRHEGANLRLRLTDDDLVGVSLFHGVGAQPQINTYDARGLPLPVFGPLSIEGLPPLSPWFRRWKLSPLISRPLAELSADDFRETPSWTEKSIEGWNVVNQHEVWGHGDFCQFGQTLATFAQPTVLEILAGGDGPLRVWWGTELVIDDPRPVRDLSVVRSSRPIHAPAGNTTITVAMNNRGGQSWGFSLRLRWTATAVLD